MAFEEKGAWLMALVAIGGYATYLGIVLGGAGSTPLTELDYGWTMLWTILGAIVTSIVLTIALGIASPRDAGRKDERDRRIGQLGEYIGQAFVVIGGVGTLILAILEVDHFWIANLVYLTFVLSAVLGSVAKIVLYRRGLPTW
jgi:hypothetical protein